MNRARPGLVEVSGALLLLAGALLELLATNASFPVAAGALAAVATTVPLAWRSVFPFATVAVTTGGLVLAVALGFPAGDLIVPYLAPLVPSIPSRCTAPGGRSSRRRQSRWLPSRSS